MPGARSRVRPGAPVDPQSPGSSAQQLGEAEEASQLELTLQRQLEEDVARIFDESISSDLEVVCGKLKILTHSCILKARTESFYHKLQTILHANIGKGAFDEIYSFVSDVYTECNIKCQEKEIIAYLNTHFDTSKSNNGSSKDDFDESDVFLTPKCATPYVDNSFQKSISNSPSTELTREYYSLVPIEGALDKELKEQDALSNAFQSIINSQTKDLKNKIAQRTKPTSLSLNSSHISQTVKHSSSCDILNNILKDNTEAKEPDVIQPSQNSKNKDLNGLNSIEIVYSPDSLITDDPSSSSDYLSAAYCSPGVTTVSLLNVGDVTKMENTFTSSDSGLENTGLLESLSSHKDITLTDVSLTESTLHDLTADETNDSTSNSFDRNQLIKFKQNSNSGTSSELNGISQMANVSELGRKSSKEEKRKKEDLVHVESSSLSSETGSWESVFPPKIAEKDVCEKFITSERQYSVENAEEKSAKPNFSDTFAATSLVQKSPFKNTSCFIDAASLVDEEDETIKVLTEENVPPEKRNEALPAPSQPLPCSTAKFDTSPNDWSESNENDDSLEQLDNKDPDSIQKDLSPTIFEMTPITEDSLCANTFETAVKSEESKKNKDIETIGKDNIEPIGKDIESMGYTSERESLNTNTVLISGTPHNSILSLRGSSLKYESEESESDSTIVGSIGAKKAMKFNESSPIVSGGASIEDHLPHMGSHSSSPLTRRRIENIPIVSGAYVPKIEEKTQNKSPKPSNNSAWVVDMSDLPKTEEKVKKPIDRTCELLRNGSKSSLDSFHSLDITKSRSSVDSDGSEKSSHKFYIDLSSLPDPLPPKTENNEQTNEKKNIFSMYIDLGEKPTKEMPARLSSSLTTRRNVTETKNVSKTNKTIKNQVEHQESVKLPDNNTSLNNFEKYETLCDDPSIGITEIIDILDKNESKAQISNNSTKIDKDKSLRHSSEKSPRNSTDKPKKSIITAPIQEEPSQTDLFVKLSDLDKPVHTIESEKVSEKYVDVRMTRSIPDSNWEEKSGTSSRSIDFISSFHSENALSLNRLFPHLKTEWSRSMPGALNPPPAPRSPLRMASSSLADHENEQGSDMSEVSSVQSSMCRSVVENSTTEDTSQTSSLIGNCQSRLGQDLLRMFLQEIAPDVVVEVSGRRIKAHKCILSSRCQYFAGILSGGWVESAGNVIVLPPFSYNVVHFALCHIYSGVATIPDSISIVELATIADMLGLEGLKEAIMFTLKAKYCHHFHRPCAVCTAGVLECFPLSSVYGLDDLYRKCLRWISKYFSRVWPTKAFATLPKELLDKCYQHLIVNMTTDNVVDTVYGCGLTVAALQNSRWAEVVARMCRRLVNASAHFAAPRLMAVLHFISDLPPDPPHPALQALDDCLAAAIEWSPPDEACRVYAYLSAVVKEMRQQQLYSKPDLITNGQRPLPSYLLNVRAASWRLQCEGALVRAAPRVVGTQAFRDLPPELRKRLRELGCIMFGPQPVNAPSPPTQERRSRTYKNNSKLDIEQVRMSFVPYSPRPTAPIAPIDLRSNNELREKKDSKLKTVPPKIRTTKAQEERAKFNLTKNAQENKIKAKTVQPRMSFENTKPRYLEPKIQKENEKKTPAKKLAPKMISSSESSRNSSPIQARALRMRNNRAADTMSQDSLASRPRTAEPSTESLSESQNSNKYATYTKAKHVKGSVESVNSSRLNTSLQQTSAYKNKTKIPVYLNQSRTNGDLNQHKKTPTKPSESSPKPSESSSKPVTKRIERKSTGSLMMATKSSSAKVVPKVLKDSFSKSLTKQRKVDKKSESTKPEIPAMERSGTFLKDEPTFGDKTTNIDIDDQGV